MSYVQRLPFDSRGHLFGVPYGEEDDGRTRVYPRITPDEQDKLALAAGKISPSVFEPFCPDLTGRRCGWCGEFAEVEVTDSTVTAKTACAIPEGITTVIRLEVPSGLLVVSDSLRPVYDWDDSEVADYNSVLGQHQAVLAMARQGCAFGPVGNSCPGLYQTGEDTYVIANLPYDDTTGKPVLPDGWEYRAGIITDLWAYSIADRDDWLAKGGSTDNLDWGDTVCAVTPGTYEFTHHTGEPGFDRDADLVVYADIKRVEGAALHLSETGDRA